MKNKSNLEIGHKAFYKTRWFMILSFIFFPPLSVFLFWRYSSRGKFLKILMTVVSAFYFLFYCAVLSASSEGAAQQTTSPQTASLSSVTEPTKAPIDVSSSEPATVESTSEANSEPQSSSSTVSSKAEQISSSSSESKIESSSSAVSSEPSKPEQSSSPAIVSSSSSASQETSRTIEISSEDEKQENISYVWITATGKKYHSSSSCGNIKHASEVTLQEAQAMGLTPCSKCY